MSSLIVGTPNDFVSSPVLGIFLNPNLLVFPKSLSGSTFPTSGIPFKHYPAFHSSSFYFFLCPKTVSYVILGFNYAKFLGYPNLSCLYSLKSSYFLLTITVLGNSSGA